jgi:hypothetical protein
MEEITTDEILQELDAYRKKIMLQKAEEYGLKDDRFWSFKQGSNCYESITGERLSVEDFLIALLSKHLTSIDDLLCSRRMLSKKVLLEKFGDALNYIDLLKEMILANIVSDGKRYHCNLIALDERLKREYLALIDRIVY